MDEQNNPTSGWQSLPDMPEGRYVHAMTTVTIDGNDHIVVSGGRDGNNNNKLSSVIYLDVNNPSAGWQSLPDMPEERIIHAMTTVKIDGNDHIVVSGGLDENGNTLSSIIYLDVNNPTSGWQSFPDMPEGRYVHAMSTVDIGGNDYIVVSGGNGGNFNRLSSVIYFDINNPSAGWQSFPDMPEGRFDRAMSIATINGNDHIVVSGGKDGNFNRLSSVIYLDVNNPGAGWQTDLTDMPEGCIWHAMTTVTINGNAHIVVSGGEDDNGNELSSVSYLDMNNPNAGWQSFPDMPEGRYVHDMSTVTINGNVHIVVSGGIDENLNDFSTIIYLDVEDPTSGCQTDFPDIPEERYVYAMSTATINGNDHIVVSGGEDDNGNELSTVIYLDVNNLNAGWQTDLPDMPETRRAHAMSTVTINGNEYIIVSGGWNDNSFFSSVIYLDVNNPTSGWQTDFPDMPEAHYIHDTSIVTINGNQYIVIAGGWDGNNNFLSTVIYLNLNDPSAGWQYLTP